MSFWETVRGHHLADVLINSLPDLANKPKQYTNILPEYKVAEYVESEIAKGSRFVATFVYNDASKVLSNIVLVIMEK